MRRAAPFAREDTPIELTAREYDLLEYLFRNQGSVVSREMLARDVWKETARATPIDNVIDVHVARLRRKIDDGFDQQAASHGARRRIHPPGGSRVIADRPPAYPNTADALVRSGACGCAAAVFRGGLLSSCFGTSARNSSGTRSRIWRLWKVCSISPPMAG